MPEFIYDSSCNTSLIKSSLIKPFNVASMWAIAKRKFQKKEKKYSTNKT